jgi:hypothetical protein
MSHNLFNRRQLLQGASSMFLAFVVSPSSASSNPAMLAYRNPGCGCCEKWAALMTESGLQVTMLDDPDLDKRRAEAGVPAELAGCHTAFMGDYIIEGHVPAEDIIRLLAESPAVRGIAVPGMPIGSPGMESGDRNDAYDVLAFKADGTWSVFASHGQG